MLLAKDYVLNEQLIEQIMSFERMDGNPLTVYVHTNAIKQG